MSDKDAYRSRIFSDSQLERILRENPHVKADASKYCPTCDKTGTYLWEDEVHACDCETQVQLLLHYLHAGIGLTYQRLDWEDYEGEKWITEKIAKYIDNETAYIKRGMGLLFTGPFGSGKTMLANLALKWLVRKGYRCYSTTFANTVEMFTAGWKSAEEKRYFQDRFVGSEVLLLDDVGRELKGLTKLSETTFDSILRTRVQYGRPTFITTNLDIPDLEEGYGSAVLSLLKEKSIIFDFQDNTDFRDKANARELREIERGEVRPIV